MGNFETKKVCMIFLVFVYIYFKACTVHRVGEPKWQVSEFLPLWSLRSREFIKGLQTCFYSYVYITMGACL